MARITPPQDIPAELYAGYIATLEPATPTNRVRRRYPWHIEESNSLAAQEVRSIFREAAD